MLKLEAYLVTPRSISIVYSGDYIASYLILIYLLMTLIPSYSTQSLILTICVKMFVQKKEKFGKAIGS